MPISTDEIKKYLDVFKGIFEKMGHEKHYEMMINKVTDEDIINKK